MAKISPISDNINKIYNYASHASLKKGQSFINTAGLFESVQRLFAADSENKFAKTSSKLKSILCKYNINSVYFNKAYAELFPVNTELNQIVETELMDDALNVIDCLNVKAQHEKTQQDVEDFLLQLFADKNYELFNVLSKISDNFKKDYDAAVEADTKEEDLPPAPFDINMLYSDIRRAFLSSTVREIKSLERDDLKQYLTNINKYVASKADLKLVGMQRELSSLEIALSGRTKTSAVLVGPAGTGKTSLVYELANRINNHDETLPMNLQDVLIYEMHVDSMVAGSQFRGQFEQRLISVLDAVSKLPNVILFIDEFHTIMKAGGNEGDLTCANIIKPYLSRGDVKIIAATTNDEYNEYVEKDKAISRRFKKVLVEEPNKEETIEIMKGVLPIDEDFFDKKLVPELLDKIYTLSTQYNLHSANPDKALTLLESAFAYARVMKAENKEVTIDDVIGSISVQYNINMSETKAEDTRKELKTFLLGQDEPLENVCKYLDMIDLNIVDPEKPRCSLLFAGPTGVGKTETAKIIAKKFTGSERNLVTVEGSSLQSETGITAIFGSDPGYVGYKATSPFLAHVKQNPNCVVLFDEIEKAHPNVFKSLLSILDEGYVKDKGGNKVSFRNAIIIFTTNLGFGKTNHAGSGMMTVSHNSGTAMTEINKHFSPEFLGRLDETIVFNRLDDSIANKLIDRYINKYEKLSGLKVKFTKSELSNIKKNADISTFGARNLDHCVKVAFAKNVRKEK